MKNIKNRIGLMTEFNSNSAIQKLTKVDKFFERV